MKILDVNASLDKKLSREDIIEIGKKYEIEANVEGRYEVTCMGAYYKDKTLPVFANTQRLWCAFCIDLQHFYFFMKDYYYILGLASLYKNFNLLIDLDTNIIPDSDDEMSDFIAAHYILQSALFLGGNNIFHIDEITKSEKISEKEEEQYTRKVYNKIYKKIFHKKYVGEDVVTFLDSSKDLLINSGNYFYDYYQYRFRMHYFELVLRRFNIIE